MSTTKSRENRELTKAESILFTADFTDQLQASETLSSVVSTVEITSLGLTVGSGTINSGGAITIDGETIATSKAIQFRISAASATPGEAIVRIKATTSDGNTRTLDCRFTLVT